MEVRDTLFGVDFGVNNTKTRENFKNANLSLKTALNEKSRNLAEVKKQNERLDSRNFSLSTEIAELKKQLAEMKRKTEDLQHRINNPSEAYLREKLAEIEEKKRQKEEAEDLKRKLAGVADFAVTDALEKFGDSVERADFESSFREILKFNIKSNIIPADVPWTWKDMDEAISLELEKRGIDLEPRQQQEQQEQERKRGLHR